MRFYCLLFLFITQNAFAQSIKFNSSGGTPDPSALMELEATDKGTLVPRMEESNRLGILSPAQGLLVFQTNGTVGFYYYNGTAWDTLGGATTVTNISNVTTVTNTNIAVVRDIKASGVDGGDFNNNAWRTRDLNDLSGDVSFISLGTNSFTLDSSIYIITASAPARRVDVHQIRLFNTTTGTVEAVGNAISAASASPISSLTTAVNVNSATNTFILQHRCETDRATDGFGQAVSWGSNVYTQIRIEKL